jgi:hypothetical protein
MCYGRSGLAVGCIASSGVTLRCNCGGGGGGEILSIGVAADKARHRVCCSSWLRPASCILLCGVLWLLCFCAGVLCVGRAVTGVGTLRRCRTTLWGQGLQGTLWVVHIAVAPGDVHMHTFHAFNREPCQAMLLLVLFGHLWTLQRCHGNRKCIHAQTRQSNMTLYRRNLISGYEHAAAEAGSCQQCSARVQEARVDKLGQHMWRQNVAGWPYTVESCRRLHEGNIARFLSQ